MVNTVGAPIVLGETKNQLFLFCPFITAERTLPAREGHLPTTSAA